MTRFLDRVDARWLALALMGASPALRADGGCGGSDECGKLPAAAADFTLVNSTCGATGTLQLSAMAGSCGVGVTAPSGSGLPSNGNRGTGGFNEPGWYLYGSKDGSPLKCTATQAASSLKLACSSEAGFSCSVDLKSK